MNFNWNVPQPACRERLTVKGFYDGCLIARYRGDVKGKEMAMTAGRAEGEIIGKPVEVCLQAMPDQLFSLHLFYSFCKMTTAAGSDCP